jgi:hypothetical protein
VVELAQAQREVARWRVLQILHAGQPVGVNFAVIELALNDAKLKIGRDQLCAELDYLQEKSLLTIERGHYFDEDEVAARLTPVGVDVVEYTVECPPGIARPAKRNA